MVGFAVQSTAVLADRDTEYKKGDCSDLRNGRDVTVTGTVLSTGAVHATRIEIKKE